jgi:bacillithiol system protein YtxJ
MFMELENDRDFEHLLTQSHQDPVVMFKHSTQCSRSAGALQELSLFSSNNASVVCAVVDVLEQRELSDQAEEQFGIRHESPQAIVLAKGMPLWHASHWKITAGALEDAVDKGKREGSWPTG